MALVVEDGTGLANADAFVSLAYADAYHSARGNTAWTGTDEAKEQAIRRATAFLSNAYRWKGERAQGRDQALAWPRSWVDDIEGHAVSATSVPWEVEQATCEVALRELTTPGTMTPDVTLTDRVRSEQVGPLRVEYLGLTSSDAARPVLTVVNDLVRGLVAVGGGPDGGAQVARLTRS